MDIFHFNENSQEAEPCAKDGYRCEFGSLSKHYTTVEATEKSVAGKLKNSSITPVAGSNSASVSKTTNSGTTGKAIDLSAILGQYRSQITTSNRIYVHPEGKVVFVYHDFNRNFIKVYKNDKASKTSATLEKLARGYGAWREVSHAEAYNAVGLKF